MAKLIGYARISTRQRSADRQQADLLADGVRIVHLRQVELQCAGGDGGTSEDNLSFVAVAPTTQQNQIGKELAKESL